MYLYPILRSTVVTQSSAGTQNASLNVWIIFLSIFSLRVPRCPCLDPAAGKVWGMAVTPITGERGTALVTACRAMPSSPPLSAAQRGSRTNQVSSVSMLQGITRNDNYWASQWKSMQTSWTTKNRQEPLLVKQRYSSVKSNRIFFFTFWHKLFG